MDGPASGEWKRYGRAVIQSLNELLEETDEQAHSLVLETADYWLTATQLLGVDLDFLKE